MRHIRNINSTIYFQCLPWSVLSLEISRRRRGMNNASQNKEQSKSNTPHSKHSSKEKKYADLKGNKNEN